MAQLDSDAIKSNFSKKTNHYWGVQGLQGLGLPDHKLVAEGYPNPNHLSPKANPEIFSACLPTSIMSPLLMDVPLPRSSSASLLTI